MSSNIVLSSAEHKIFLAIAVFICCLFFTNLSNKAIVEYNDHIKTAQIEKRDLAIRNERIQLSGCYPCTTPFFMTMLQLQIFVLPLIFFSLIKRHLRNIIFSFTLSLFLLFGYFGWISHTHYTRIFADNAHFMDLPFYNYLLLNSTILDFILSIMLSVLCILQISILLRFVIEKFQAKILT